MNVIIEFIKIHYELIIKVAILVASVVFFIVKKRPIKLVDTLQETIVTWLPSILCNAEETGLKGEAKLNYAIDLIFSLFVKDYYSREEFDKRYLPFVKKQIEAILSTPQKKGE